MKSSTSAKTKKRRSEHSDTQKAKKPNLEASVERPRNAEECGANWKKFLSEVGKKSSATSGKVKEVRNQRKKIEVVKKGDNKTAVWFDDVPEEEILMADGIIKQRENGTGSLESDGQLVKSNAFCGLTKVSVWYEDKLFR